MCGLVPGLYVTFECHGICSSDKTASESDRSRCREDEQEYSLSHSFNTMSI